MPLNLAGAAVAVRPLSDSLFKRPLSSTMRYSRTALFMMLFAAMCVHAQTVTTTVSSGFAPYAIAVNPVTNKVYVANYLSNNVTAIDGATNLTTTVAVGDEPVAVAINPVTNKIYVANSGSNDVTIIDGSTNSSITISAGTRPVALAVNALTNKIYAANKGSGTVTVIDGGTNLASTITVGTQPAAVALNPVTNTIYVANGGSGTVTAINGATAQTTGIGVGSQPIALAVNPATNAIYVANNGSNNVTVINGASNSTVTVSAGSQPIALAANTITNKVYVANSGSGDVTVIDGPTNSTSSLGAGSQPYTTVVNAVTNKIYVANQGSGTVTVIDGTSYATTSFGTGANPSSMAVNPVTNKIYVANSGSDNVTVADGATNATVTAGAGSQPSAIVVDGLNHKAWLVNSGSNEVTEIDGKTNSAVTLSVGVQPVAVALNPVTKNVYVANSGSNNVTVIDGTSGAMTNIGTGTQPVAIAVNPVTNKIYVANNGSGDVTAIDGATNATSTVSVGPQPVALAINPATNKIYVASQGNNTVTAIDGASNSTKMIAVGSGPAALAVNPVTNTIYAANTGDNTVTAIDGATGNTITLGTGSQPVAMAVNPLTNKLYVANSGSNNVTVIDGVTNVASTVAAGNQPVAVTVDSVMNKIYAINGGSGNVTVIDGATNTSATVVAGIQPSAVAVDSLSNKIYVANTGSSNVTVITGQNMQAVPLQAGISSVLGNQTTPLAPKFDFTARNSVASRAATVTSLAGSATISAASVTPPADNVFYQVDTWQGTWTASANQGAGAFSGSTTPLQPGFHVLYAYATDGGEAASTSSGAQSSPLISNISGLGFLVTASDDPTGTTQQTITFNPPASVTYSPGLAIDITNFASSDSQLPITYALLSGGSGQGSLSGNLLTVTQAGTFIIQASQGGNSTYAPAQNVTQTLTVNPKSQTITFPNPSAVSYASGLVVNLTGDANSDSGLVVTYALLAGGSGQGSLTGTMLTVTQAGTFTIQASQNGNANYSPAANVTASLTVNPGNQTINFPTPPAATYSAGLTVNLSGDANATSGLPVAYTLLLGGTGAGTISGALLSVTQAGTFSIQASQNGNPNFSPAPNVTSTLTVNQASQTISFGALSSQTYGAAPFTVSATASSGLAVTFVSTTNTVCTVSVNTVTIAGAGTCSITASQSGNLNYSAAPNLSQSFTVNQAGQTISFGALSSQTYGAAPFTVSAAASSGLAVTFVSTTNTVCTVSGATVTVVGAGTCSITASQPGNTNYSAAPNVTQGFAVSQAGQTITFGALSAQTYGVAPITVTATATSNLAVTFTSTTSTVCTVSGNMVTIVGTGTCSLTASQAGNVNYSVALNVTQSFLVNQASQTITFGNPGSQIYGVPLTLSASANPSGLPVTFLSNTTSVCTVSGKIASFIGVGTCSITASQSGNSNYSTAPSVTQIFAVNQASQTITFGALSNQTYGAAPFNISASSTSGLTVSFASTTPTVCTVSGNAVSIIGTGTCSITASQSGNVDYLPAPNVIQSFTVNQASQTITFPALGNQSYGVAPFTIGATASSSLAVTFSSNSTTVCTVSGSTVTIVGAGTCSISASQGGNANYLAAANVIQSFTVNKAASTTVSSNISAMVSQNDQNVTLMANVTSLAGAVNQGTVTFTLFNGSNVVGVPVTSSTVVNGSTSVSYTIPGNTPANSNYIIQAVFNGSGNLLTSTDSSHNLNLTGFLTATTAHSATATFSANGQGVILSATVSGSPTVGVGTVTFSVFLGGKQIGFSTTSGVVSGGVATATYTLPGNSAAGAYYIYAVYSGGGSYAASSDNSGNANLTVIQAATAATATGAAATYSLSAQNVLLTASVTSAGLTVNAGTVTFSIFNGGLQIGSPVTSGPVNGGTASATFLLPGGTAAGAYFIHAVYNGSSNLLPSSDNTQQLTILPAPSTTVASNVSATFNKSDQTITLSAAMTSGVGTVNGGTVTFTVLTPVSSSVTSGTVTNGLATAAYLMPGGTATGVYTIQAVYSGAGSFASSSDSSHTLTVMPDISQALMFVPVTPCRIADTRSGNGFSGQFGPPQLAANGTRSFALPSSGCGIPSAALAYSINVTVVPISTLGFVTVWPTGQAQPNVSTLNSPDGRIKANAAIIPSGTNGSISVYSTDATQFILDIDGYFVPANTNNALAFYPVNPCRVVDTRGANGSLGGPSISSGTFRSFPILSACSIPSSAQAYSLNFTAVPKSTLQYLTVWPTGQSQPMVSTLNAPTGTFTANAAIVPAGASGFVSVYASDTTDVVIDIDGYFAPPGNGGLSLYTLPPCRVIDTRSPQGSPPFNGTLPVNVFGSGCGVPSTAQAYVFNATVVPPGPLTYLTLWPDGQAQPFVSTLNATDGAITSNMALVPTTNGWIDAFGSDPTQLILDLSSFFAP